MNQTNRMKIWIVGIAVLFLAGSGSAIIPADGLVLHVNAQNVDESGGAVTKLLDLSSIGIDMSHNASQGDAYGGALNRGRLNGQDTITMTNLGFRVGMDDSKQLNVTDKGLTLFLVARLPHDSTSAQRILRKQVGSVNNPGYNLLMYDDRIDIWASQDGSNRRRTTYREVDTDFVVLAMRIDPSSDTLSAYYNGERFVTTARNGGLGDLRNEAHFDMGEVKGMEFAELIVYNHALTEEVLNGIGYTLGVKYNVITSYPPMQKSVTSITKGLAVNLLARKPKAHDDFIFATTIDFLDYCFFDEASIAAGYLPLEVYENYLREIAEAGVKKLYLRVNVRGLTLYPTKVTLQYGEEGRFHWHVPDRGERLMKTLSKYNPLDETIRIGHTYGMEVWAWESLWEDGGVGWLGFIPQDEKYMQYLNLAAECRFDAMTTPFFMDHPDYFSMRDPKLSNYENVKKLNLEARSLLPIEKIVLTDHVKHRKKVLPQGISPIRIKPEDIRIMVSENNTLFVPYERGFSFDASVTPEGFNRIVIEALEIDAPYVKLTLHESFSTEASDVTMALSKEDRRSQFQVYNRDGKLIPAVWAVEARDPRLPLSFAESRREAWDLGSNRSLGFCVGEPEPQLHWEGVAEITIPAVQEHKLARFAELAEYPFDGFMINLRSHAWTGDSPESFGYNNEVRELYLDRYGVDIWQDDADLHRLHSLRMGSVADLIGDFKKATSDRPLYISGWAPHEWKPGQGMQSVSAYMYRRFLHLPFPYEQLFREGSVDGVMMVGYDFSDYFCDDITSGRAVKLGIFRELYHLTSGREMWLPSGYNMRRDFENISSNSGISEAELYETLILTQQPDVLKIIADLNQDTPCAVNLGGKSDVKME